jgi:hypothetical protein
VPLESVEDWHTVRLDASTFVYIPVDATRRLTEAEINASPTPTSPLVQASATLNISQNPTTNSVVVPPQAEGNVNIPPPISGGQNPPVHSPVPTHTPVVVNTLIPTRTQNSASLTDIPPSPTLSGANDLPPLPSLTPSPSQAPPPLIILPPPN